MTNQRPLALVTGGSSGIGFELAKQFAQNGFDVAISGSSDKVYHARIEAADDGSGFTGTLRQRVDAPRPGAIYNLCDDDPAPPEAVIAHAAELLGVPVPPAEDYATAEMTPMARSFYAESKRVANDRIKRDLGVALRYPGHRAGLLALLADEG